MCLSGGRRCRGLGESDADLPQIGGDAAAHDGDAGLAVGGIIEFDEEWFRGKAVIVFDDVITRGISFGMYANQLESFGANVIEGIFLARTHYKV